MGNIGVSIKKFISNKNTVTILGVLLAVVVFYFGYTWRVNQAVNPVQVPYATETLIAESKITEDKIGYVDIQKDVVESWDNIITNPGDLTNNKLVSFDAKIPKNSFFFTDSVIDEKDMPDSVFSNIPDGYTIFALDVDSKLTYSNSIFPEDMIDLYLYAETEEDGKVIYGRFIKSIQVLAVKDGDGKNVFANKDELGEPAQLLFAVPEDLFLLLKKAIKSGNFDIEPVPRNDSYTKDAAATELVSAELEAIIIAQTFIIPGECTDLTQCG